MSDTAAQDTVVEQAAGPFDLIAHNKTDIIFRDHEAKTNPRQAVPPGLMPTLRQRDNPPRAAALHRQMGTLLEVLPRQPVKHPDDLRRALSWNGTDSADHSG